MAWQTLSALPVNIKHVDKNAPKELTFHSLPGSKFQPPQPAEDDELTLKSLRIIDDPRMQGIKSYQNSAKNTSQFSRRLNKQITACQEEKSEGLTFTDIANIESKQLSSQVRANQYSLQERVDWQESFDKSVTKLMIDFDLTHEPGCRLNHLDRMAEWFQEHGNAKQQRKARKAPSYIVADRSGRMPPGSTANVTGKLSGTSQLLAGSYRLGNRLKFLRKDGSQSAR